MESQNNKLSFSQLIRIIFPEVQLIDYINQHGWRGKKQHVQAHQPINLTTKNTSNAYLAGPAYGPENLASVKEVVKDAKIGLKTLTLNRSNENIDEIFNEIAAELNKLVFGQENLIFSLTTAFKKAFYVGNNNIVQNTILLAGPPGTGKNKALSILINQLYKRNLVPYNRYLIIDLANYSDLETHSNFIMDCTAAFQDGLGTVCFKGLDKATPEMLAQVGKLFNEGSFRTIEGTRIDAAGYFLIAYLDTELETKQENVITMNTLPASIAKGIKDTALSTALTDEVISKILKEKFIQSAAKLAKQAHLQINFTPELFTVLTPLIVKSGSFGEAIDVLIEKEFYQVLLDLRARGSIPKNAEVLIRLQDNQLEALCLNQAIKLKSFSLYSEETLEDILKELDHLTGLKSIKEFVKQLIDTVNVNLKRQENGLPATPMTLHMVFTGNPGTGKTTVARIISRVLKALKIVSQGHLVEATKQDLVGEFVGSTAPKTSALLNQALGGVLFIDEAYSLVRDEYDIYGIEAIDTLVKGMEDNRDNLVVILAGYTKEMANFLDVNSGLPSRFPLVVEFPDYTPEEMLEILTRTATSRGYQVDPGLKQPLLDLFNRKQIPGRNDSGNGRLVRNILEEAIRKQASRINTSEVSSQELNLLTASDFALEAKTSMEQIDSELEEIIGLTEVKSFINSLAAQIKVANQRKELGLSSAQSQTLHMIFKGNPGTGKTTMARILAKKLKELQVLKSGHLIETDRSDLVAAYVGQTALKTKKVIEDALGGVLFIDEAYALSKGEDEFGLEAIDTLVKAMDDHRENLIVILAGYNQDMDDFLKTNPGLRSRFPHIITFPDYSPEELLSISRLIFKGKQYTASPEAEEKLLKIFKAKIGDKTAGNGRLVRNLCEAAIRKHAERISSISNPSLQLLTAIEPMDIDENSKLDNSGKDKRIGFI